MTFATSRLLGPVGTGTSSLWRIMALITKIVSAVASHESGWIPVIMMLKIGHCPGHSGDIRFENGLSVCSYDQPFTFNF